MSRKKIEYDQPVKVAITARQRALIFEQAVLPLLSVGEMTLRLYAALNYSQNSALDLRRALNGA